VMRSESKWFFGPRGLVLKNPLASLPIAAVGMLGYFAWSAGDPAAIIPKPSRWMERWGLEEPPSAKQPQPMPLFEDAG
jgi:hypothetical protein